MVGGAGPDVKPPYPPFGVIESDDECERECEEMRGHIPEASRFGPTPFNLVLLRVYITLDIGKAEKKESPLVLRVF